MLLWFCLANFGVLFSSVVLGCWYTPLLGHVVSVPISYLGVCLSVNLHIIDLWQCYVCCTRSGVKPCTLFMVLFLCHMCWGVLHAVQLSHISTLKRPLAAEPHSTSGLLFPSISVEWSWWPYIWWCGSGGFQEQGLCLFISLAAQSLFVSYCFPFLFFHSTGWYCGILTHRVKSLAPIIALPTVFNNSNSNNNNILSYLFPSSVSCI